MAALHCRHNFCHDCFRRYVNGSLDELNNYLRCSICGAKSHLTSECHEEYVILRFGRDGARKLTYPTGILSRSNGDFIIMDRDHKRGFIFTRDGVIKDDFSFVHDTKPMDGIAMTQDGLIVAPFRTQNRDVITYFTQEGDVLTSTFLNRWETPADITGIVVDSNNWIIAADCANSTINFIHPDKRHTKAVKILPCAGERTPEPRGITVNKQNDIIIADWANDCIRILDSLGNHKWKFGSRGERPGQFNEPYGVAVASSGHIFVAEKGNNRVQIFTPEGEFIRYLVRYSRGDDIYLAPFDLVCLPNQEVAVLLVGSKDARAAEVRIYPYILDLY